MSHLHFNSSTPFKDLSLSSYQNGQWIWHSLSTTEFPYSRLTHSYITEENLGTLPITISEKVGLGVILASTCLVNFGLLFHSVKKAGKIGKGNTIVVIEHNLDVIKTADWIVDMGPEGGVNGGQIIAEGSPEKITEINGSYTGNFLKNIVRNKLKKTA